MFSLGIGAAKTLGLLGILGNAAGSGLNYLANKKLQEDAQEHQLYMSNTAYQRGIADMKAAGLNPNLLLSNGGAAVTGSSSSNSSSVSDLSSSLTNYYVNSALSKQNFQQQLYLQNDRQAFERAMSETKTNSAFKNNIMDKMEKL